MYQRNNKFLVRFWTFLLALVLIAGFLLTTIYIVDRDPEAFEMLGRSTGGIVVQFGIAVGLSYALMTYFKRQLELSKSPNGPSTETLPKVNYATASSSTSERTPPKTPVDTITDPYQRAGEEALSGKVDAAMWARALVEGGGADGPVKAAYIKLRVADIEEKLRDAQLEKEARAHEEAQAQAEQERRHQEKIEEEKKKVEEESRAQVIVHPALKG